MKKYKSFIRYLPFLVIVIILGVGLSFSYFSKRPLEKPSPSKKTFHIQEQLNENSMNMIKETFVKHASEKFDTNINNIKNKSNKINLTVHFKTNIDDYTKIGEINGSIRVNNRNYGLSGKGVFESFKAPDTDELYYFGHIEANLKGVKKHFSEPDHNEYDGNNCGLIVVFSPTNDKSYISASIGLQETTGALIFGDIDLVSEEYYYSYKEQMQDKAK